MTPDELKTLESRISAAGTAAARVEALETLQSRMRLTIDGFTVSNRDGITAATRLPMRSEVDKLSLPHEAGLLEEITNAALVVVERRLAEARAEYESA